MQQTKTTHYHYNAHRLDSVSYDDALTTIYHYDQYGRVDSLYDESGVMCYTYGNMGEVTYTNHEIQGIRMRPSSRKTVVLWGT